MLAPSIMRRAGAVVYGEGQEPVRLIRRSGGTVTGSDFAASLPGVPTERRDEDEAQPMDSSDRVETPVTEEESPPGVLQRDVGGRWSRSRGTNECRRQSRMGCFGGAYRR